jgi:hypothetical protein
MYQKPTHVVVKKVEGSGRVEQDLSERYGWVTG